MSTAQLQRAIVWAFLATLLALIGVTSVAWIRRPKSPPPPATAVQRGARPVLANEPDGSVYDLNLKIAELQERLGESEGLVVDQQQRLEEAERGRATLQDKLTEIEAEIQTLQAAVEALRAAAAPPEPEPGSNPPTGPPLPGGPLTTPTPAAPAAPP